MSIQIKQVLGGDNSLAPRVFEFEHSGPSRSGKAKISVMIAPNESGFSINYLVVYMHHEGTESYYPAQWQEFVHSYKIMLDPAESSGFSEYDHQDAMDVLSIAEIVQSIVQSASISNLQ